MSSPTIMKSIHAEDDDGMPHPLEHEAVGEHQGEGEDEEADDLQEVGPGVGFSKGGQSSLRRSRRRWCQVLDGHQRRHRPAGDGLRLRLAVGVHVQRLDSGVGVQRHGTPAAISGMDVRKASGRNM